MGCFQSKNQPNVVRLKNTKKNNNITLHLRARESGSRRSNGTGTFMENYVDEILRLYAGNVLYANGPTYEQCIQSFRKNVPTNCAGYEKMKGHFTWLRFEMEPHACFLDCHMNDFVGSMRLETVNYLLEIGYEPYGAMAEELNNVE